MTVHRAAGTTRVAVHQGATISGGPVVELSPRGVLPRRHRSRVRHFVLLVRSAPVLILLLRPFLFLLSKLLLPLCALRALHLELRSGLLARSLQLQTRLSPLGCRSLGLLRCRTSRFPRLRRHLARQGLLAGSLLCLGTQLCHLVVQLANHSLRVIDVFDRTCDDLFSLVRVPESRERLLSILGRRVDGAEHEGIRVAAERILKEPRQHRLAVRHRTLLCLSEHRDALAQTKQRLINGACLSQPGVVLPRA